VNPIASPRVVDLASTTPSAAALAAASKAPFVHLDVFAPAPARRVLLPAAPAGPAATWTAPLRDIEGARVRLDGLLAEARRGRAFSPQELLCLQADAHRFAQSVEFAARAVEHGVQGLRQALQAQV
jgi:hypothetical protein